MGFLCALALMTLIVVVSMIVSRWAPRAAYRLLEHSQHLFETEGVSVSDSSTQPQTHARNRTLVKRPYISPVVKKRVAAKQGWRCAVCKELLDETFETDHRTPLFRGGHATDESNLQSLCKRCHLFKSAVLDHA